MEHALINELITLLCKGGSETFVGNFQKGCGEGSYPAQWSHHEVAEALNYVRYINEYFGKDEAVAIVTSLIAKYNLSLADFQLRPASQLQP